MNRRQRLGLRKRRILAWANLQRNDKGRHIAGWRCCAKTKPASDVAATTARGAVVATGRVEGKENERQWTMHVGLAEESV